MNQMNRMENPLQAAIDGASESDEPYEPHESALQPSIDGAPGWSASALSSECQHCQVPLVWPDSQQRGTCAQCWVRSP